MISLASTVYLLILAFGLFDYFKMIEAPFSRMATMTRLGMVLVFCGFLSGLHTRKIEAFLQNRFCLLFTTLILLFTTNTVVSYIASGLLSEYYVPLLQPLLIFFIVTLTFENEKALMPFVKGFVGLASLVSVALLCSQLNIRFVEDLLFVQPVEFLDRIRNVTLFRPTVFGLNVNTTGYLLSYAVVLNAFLLSTSAKRKLLKILYSSALGVVCLANLSLMAIGPTISALAGMLVWSYYQKRIARGAFLCVFVLLCFGMLFNDQLTGFFNKAYLRFISGGVVYGESTYYRWESLLYSWNVFLDSPWIGIGDVHGTMPRWFNTANHFHYLELAAVYGVFAAILFVSMQCLTLGKLFRMVPLYQYRPGIDLLPLALLCMNIIVVFKAIFSPIWFEDWLVMFIAVRIIISRTWAHDVVKIQLQHQVTRIGPVKQVD